MMIRGRHRGLPYQLDRAIMLPGRMNERDGEEGRIVSKERREMAKMKRFQTQ
jgi:hypothetical protein